MRLLIITNIPTPYRVSFFNLLNEKITLVNGILKINYCAKNEPGRHWIILKNDHSYSYKYLRGIHINIHNLHLHFNPGIINEIRTFKPEVILFAGSWNMPTVIFALFYLRIFAREIKSLFWSEGHEGSVLHKNGIIPYIRKFVLNRFSAFAVPNQRSKRYLFDHLKVRQRPVIMLPNTVDGDFYSKPPYWSVENSARIKIEHGLPEDAKICLQVSQIEERKGVRELVEFWTQLPPEIKKDFVLVLVGEGSLKSELQKNINNNTINDIYLLGNQTKNAVRELLFSSDIFILLTKNDPNPLSLIEACYANLPIITTIYAGNHNEIVNEKVNGAVIRELNYSEFERAFKKLINIYNDENVRQFSFKNVNRQFNIRNVSCQFVKQINKL